jgi:alanine dehydrogenase
VEDLVAHGHEVLLESGAGLGSGFQDAAYAQRGARIVPGPRDIYACPMVVKVKELQTSELEHLRRGSLVVGYQQLARDPELLTAVLDAGITCLAYEGVLLPDGRRPMLAPMSTLAGLLSAQIAAWALQRREGSLSGSGTLLQRMEGVPPAQVLILGDGVAGEAAARSFLRLGCQVAVLGLDPTANNILKRLEPVLCGDLETARSTPEELAGRIPSAEVVIGAIAIPGKLSPRLVTRNLLRTMRPGSVFIDIGIDMGGIAETSRQTKLSDPLYVEEGVLHYGVPNIPALVPRTATEALTAATLPYVRGVADLGLAAAMEAMPELAHGLLVHAGHVVNPDLARDCGRACVPFAASPNERM